MEQNYTSLLLYMHGAMTSVLLGRISMRGIRCGLLLPMSRGLSLFVCVYVLKLIHTATPDTTKRSRLCRVCFGGVNWIPDNSKLSPTENLKSEHVQSNRPIHAGTPDTTQTGLSCRVWWAVWIRHCAHWWAVQWADHDAMRDVDSDGPRKHEIYAAYRSWILPLERALLIMRVDSTLVIGSRVVSVLD